MTDYQPTPGLPDAEGEALLQELLRLYCTTQWDEKGKEIRRSSNARRATAALHVAWIKTAARFERHAEFHAWLCRNNAEWYLHDENSLDHVSAGPAEHAS